MLQEALEGFFEDCIEHGTLWAALDQAGLTPSATSVVVAEPPTARQVEWLDIPFWMLAGAQPETAHG